LNEYLGYGACETWADLQDIPPSCYLFPAFAAADAAGIHARDLMLSSRQVFDPDQGEMPC
jgi:hypothetical protein